MHHLQKNKIVKHFILWITFVFFCILGVLINLKQSYFVGPPFQSEGDDFICTETAFQKMTPEYVSDKNLLATITLQLQNTNIKIHNSDINLANINTDLISALYERSSTQVNLKRAKESEKSICPFLENSEKCQEMKYEISVKHENLIGISRKIKSLQTSLKKEQIIHKKISDLVDGLHAQIFKIEESQRLYDECQKYLQNKPTITSVLDSSSVYDASTHHITTPISIISSKIEATPCTVKVTGGEVQLAAYDIKSPLNYATDVNFVYFTLRQSSDGDYLQDYFLTYDHDQRIQCTHIKTNDVTEIKCHFPKTVSGSSIIYNNTVGRYTLFGSIREIEEDISITTELTGLGFNQDRIDVQNSTSLSRIIYTPPVTESLHIENIDISGDKVVVNYCQKKPGCVSLYDTSGKILHYKQLFCHNTDKMVLDMVDFSGLTAGKTVKLRYDDADIQSNIYTVSSYCPMKTLPTVTVDLDSDNVIDEYDAYLATEITAGRITPKIMHRVRNLTLDTRGNSLIQAVESDSTLTEYDEYGYKINDWKTKYQKKGHARSICNPPVLNISFDKKKDDGTPKPLFDGRSTFPGKPFLQYQEIRAIDQCNVEEYSDHHEKPHYGLLGNVGIQLMEYFIFSALRSIDVAVVDVVDFAHINFIHSLESDFTHHTYQYMLLQRDNEIDDEMSFYQQFHLDNTLVEDGKSDIWRPAESNRYWDVKIHDVAKNTLLTLNLERENAIRYFVMTHFFQIKDRGTLHNEEYGKILGTNSWKSIPHGFDMSMPDCTVNEGSVQESMDSIVQNILTNPDTDKQKQDLKYLYTITHEIFGDTNALYKLLSIVDQYPFEKKNGEGKRKLKEYIRLRFHDYHSYINSEKFAQQTLQPFVDNHCKSNIPFVIFNGNSVQKQRNDFINSCSILDPFPDVRVDDISGRDFSINTYSSQPDDRESAGKNVHLSYQIAFDITAGKEDIKIPKNNPITVLFPLRVYSIGTEQNKVNNLAMYSSFFELGNLIDIPGPYYMLPAGKTTHIKLGVSKQIYLYSNEYIKPGDYEITLSKIYFSYGMEALPIKNNNIFPVTLKPEDISRETNTSFWTRMLSMLRKMIQPMTSY